MGNGNGNGKAKPKPSQVPHMNGGRAGAAVAFRRGDSRCSLRFSLDGQPRTFYVELFPVAAQLTHLTNY